MRVFMEEKIGLPSWHVLKIERGSEEKLILGKRRGLSPVMLPVAVFVAFSAFSVAAVNWVFDGHPALAIGWAGLSLGMTGLFFLIDQWLVAHTRVPHYTIDLYRGQVRGDGDVSGFAQGQLSEVLCIRFRWRNSRDIHAERYEMLCVRLANDARPVELCTYALDPQFYVSRHAPGRRLSRLSGCPMRIERAGTVFTEAPRDAQHQIRTRFSVVSLLPVPPR